MDEHTRGGPGRQHHLADDVAGGYTPALADMRGLGTACAHGLPLGCFDRFADELDRALDLGDDDSCVTFYGSGDFHHVSLALLRRLKYPANLLVIDNHPDWMRGVPILHCGTWLYHAARLPHIKPIFHVGGDVDFDNRYRWLAPWPMLEAGKIAVFPSVRRFHRGPWRHIALESCGSAARYRGHAATPGRTGANVRVEDCTPSPVYLARQGRDARAKRRQLGRRPSARWRRSKILSPPS